MERRDSGLHISSIFYPIEGTAQVGGGQDKEEISRLMERRESGLHISSIFHPIEGGQEKDEFQ